MENNIIPQVEIVFRNRWRLEFWKAGSRSLRESARVLNGEFEASGSESSKDELEPESDELSSEKIVQSPR
jgi:hypothetical protein